MMFLNKLKNLAEKIPPRPGIILNKIPFQLRLGKGYKFYQDLANDLFHADDWAKRMFIVQEFKSIINHHLDAGNKFYVNHFSKAGLDTNNLKTIRDISNIPLINKAILKQASLEDRSNFQFALKKANTGGTTGSPLSFILDKGYYSREWAHMHHMWQRVGYHPSRTKITIRGKNIGKPVIYNFNQNEFIINSYHTFTYNDYVKLLSIFKKYNTEFVHGYPSSIFNFIKSISRDAPFLLDFLRRNIVGILFCSEYPLPQYRNYIEDQLTDNSISFYGHSEGVILAGEMYQKYEYVPFLSYGYAEGVKFDEQYHLVGTSFKNLATPFIRYDTEDLINPNMHEDGRLLSFEIKEGRLGEFVVDKMNNNIALTGLIFGRHHKIFEYADFVQVRQTFPGQIIIYYSTDLYIEDPSKLFDFSNLNLDIKFQKIEKPFKTNIGKVPLLIK